LKPFIRFFILSLTLVRGPLAFLFLFDNTSIRLAAIALAAFTDSIDGYLARRNHLASQRGAVLDALMDKFFVFFALAVMMSEGKIAPWQTCAMISRDFALIFFGIYLSLSGHWQAYQIQSIRWGKISTSLQFIVLTGLSLSIRFPWYLYCLFILFGTLAFFELCQLKKRVSTQAPDSK
jgi:CDP-diacylglycerol---glycerol-3-phosphate 3-phosphatidyltransferase